MPPPAADLEHAPIRTARRPIRRSFGVAGLGRVEVYACLVPADGVRLSVHFPARFGEYGQRQTAVPGEDAHVAALAVAGGSMPPYVVADWIEEQAHRSADAGLVADAAYLLRHPDLERC